MDTYFNCTVCGKCCRDLKLPLTADEATDWLARGHQVQLICEASPWPGDLGETDLPASHFHNRSFAVVSGRMPARVAVMLAANLAGACPNLAADMRCRIYDDRPLVCRIYPAEVNPFVELDPAKKRCPPEAWTSPQPLARQPGRLVPVEMTTDIGAWRTSEARNAEFKGRICAALSITDTALVHEAALVYSPEPGALLAALSHAASGRSHGQGTANWRFVSDRPQTIEDLRKQGGIAIHAGESPGAAYQHVRFERQPLFRSYPGQSGAVAR